MKFDARDKWLLILLGLSLAFVGGGVVWILVSLGGASQPIIIHFDDIEGFTHIGNIKDLFAIAAIGTLIIFMNFVILYFLKSRNYFLANILAITTLFLALLLFIGFAAIINANCSKVLGCGF